MSHAEDAVNPIILGDPVPWFSAPVVTGGAFNLQVAAGRWIVISFFESADEHRAMGELGALLREPGLFEDDRLVFHGVLCAPPQNFAAVIALSGPAISFVTDPDGEISRRYGASATARTVVLDPMLRAVADIPWDHPDGHAGMLRGLLRSLPHVDDAAGVPMSAPVLMVPRVFEFPFCELLVGLYDRAGGRESGFMLDVEGKTQTVIDHRLKRRSDLPLVSPELRQAISDRVVRRLIPAIRTFFQFNATRMDRYIISCYDGAVGGHFYRHRDNVNAGAQHRRFAISLNLNNDYDGCDLIFPEFGRRVYRAPFGGAVVFSCGALHEVTPITRGKRYAFLAFLYGEADAAVRETNNERLGASEERYDGVGDRLYPTPMHA